MLSNKHSADLRDDDIYTMLYLYHHKGASLENLEQRFSIKQEKLLDYLEGRRRRECYENYKNVEKRIQGAM